MTNSLQLRMSTTVVDVGTTDNERSRLVKLWIQELASRHGGEAEVARKLKVNPSTVNRWKNGGGIDLPNLIKIAELSGLSLGDILMAFYGVSPEQLAPTTPVLRADHVVLADGTNMPGRYRMMLVYREDD